MWSYNGQPKSVRHVADTPDGSLYVTAMGDCRIVDEWQHVLVSPATLLAFAECARVVESNASVCGEG